MGKAALGAIFHSLSHMQPIYTHPIMFHMCQISLCPVNFLFFFTLCCVLPPSCFIFSLSVCMYVVVSAHACLHVCGCLCVHAHLLTSRGGGPSSPQTNPPLSLKAVIWVQAGRRQQTGPAGKEESSLMCSLTRSLNCALFKFHLPLIFVKNFIGKLQISGFPSLVLSQKAWKL